MKFLCDNCKAKYQIADEKVAGKTVRMKCRKCGHQIEVRAAVTETSVASQPPPPNAPKLAARPTGGGLATSLSATKPRAPSSPSAGGALAGAFRSQVTDGPSSLRPDSFQTASEVGAISVTDEWYVAINGVPVGPVRISELRRKAAAGAVNEDSLCWQEGLEEWRPIRAIPELAALVREAMLGNRPSLVAPEPPAARVTPPARGVTPVPPAPAASTAPPAPRPGTDRPAPVRPSAPARSNVVPFHGRGPSAPGSGAIDVDVAPVTAPLGGNAAAARAPSFTPAPSPVFAPQPTPDPFTFNPVLPAPTPTPPPPAKQSGSYDPFAIGAPPAPTPAAAPVISPLSSTPSIPPGYMPVDQQRRGVPLWFWPILLLALGFGGMVAFMVFRQPAPQPVVIQMPPTATAPATHASEVPPPPPSSEAAPTPTESAAPAKKVATGPRVAAPAAPANTGKAADLSGLVGGSGSGGPVVGGGNTGGGQTGGGGTFDQAAVERVVANHRAGVKRTCWERNSGPDQKSSVNVTVNATVAPNGTVSSASSNGDDPIVAKCIENQVRTWTFPAPGESKQIALPFKFVRQ